MPLIKRVSIVVVVSFSSPSLVDSGLARNLVLASWRRFYNSYVKEERIETEKERALHLNILTLTLTASIRRQYEKEES